MNLLIFILLTVGVYYHRTCCKTIATTDYTQMVPRSMKTSITNSRGNYTNKQLLWNDSLSNQNSSNANIRRSSPDSQVDPSNRKSKILNSLVFLTSSGISGLANAAPSNAVTYTKLPPIALNAEASQISPQIAAVYNPYSYVAHPYVFSTPLGVYPLWEPLRVHSNFHTLPQNLQTLNLLNNNKPSDQSSNYDEYVEEAKKVENVKAPSNAGGNDENGAEFEDEDDKNAKEKMTMPDAACGVSMKINALKGSTQKDVSKERENLVDYEQNIAANVIKENKTHAMISNNTGSTTTMPTADDTTQTYNYTNYPFYGYYGGYPQNVNHIDLTTASTNDYSHHDYEHINYNLPSYDKPVNFYSDQKYNYYPVPSVDSYPSHQFHHEQIPEYYSNDVKRYLYTSDNKPLLVNSDFKPMV